MLNEATARNDYTGDGGVSQFTFSFKVYLKGDLEVLLGSSLQTLDTHYKVLEPGGLPFESLSASSLPAAGKVEFIDSDGNPSPPASGTMVTLLRKQKIEQSSDYVLNESMPSDRIEKDLDKLAMILQQIAEAVQRTLRFAKNSLKKDIDVPDPVASALLSWSADGTKLENKTAAQAGVNIVLGGQVAQIDVGDPQDNGAALTAARSDHQHALTAPGIPADVTKATAQAGLSAKVAREDHKHNIVTALPVTQAFGDAALEGTASTLARSDHRHGMPIAVPSGGIIACGGSSAPSGWLLCDGTAVSRATYADLFNAIGATYGAGDGSTTFNVPDLRGRFPAGENPVAGPNDNGRLAAGSLRGTAGGERNHTLIISEMPAHTHGIGGIERVFAGADKPSPEATADVPSTSTGGNGAHNTVPPYQIVNYIIKT